MNTLPKKKKLFSVRSLWRLRYRAYAVLIIVILLPIMFADNNGIPPKVDFINHQTLSSNFLFEVVAKKVIVADANTGGNPSRQTNSNLVTIDKTGEDITAELQRNGYNLGFISSDAFVDLGINQETEQVPATEAVDRKRLDSIIPRPQSPQRTNFLRYPQYNINAPIIYSSLEDLFNLKPNCNKSTDAQACLDFGSPRDNGPADSPVQQKLRDGIVHIAFTPQPGEIGNSYIVGHSSNYSWVPSAYNAVFKPLEKRSKVGEEFFIYDAFGRELKFRVFEVLEIDEKDTPTAYATFGEKRVVTLQTSVLEFVPGRGYLPTKRWLTRGELVL